MTVRQIRGEHITVTDVLRAAADANAEVEAYVEMAGPGSSGLVPDGADGRRRLELRRVGRAPPRRWRGCSRRWG